MTLIVHPPRDVEKPREVTRTDRAALGALNPRRLDRSVAGGGAAAVPGARGRRERRDRPGGDRVADRVDLVAVAGAVVVEDRQATVRGHRHAGPEVDPL